MGNDIAVAVRRKDGRGITEADKPIVTTFLAEKENEANEKNLNAYDIDFDHPDYEIMVVENPLTTLVIIIG
jgi:succinate dehydrogenase flavin-adding protein (antitoxin of CptAB toxin-antitoxin module)